MTYCKRKIWNLFSIHFVLENRTDEDLCLVLLQLPKCFVLVQIFWASQKIWLHLWLVLLQVPKCFVLVQIFRASPKIWLHVCLVLLQVPKCFGPVQKFIYILWQSQTFCARQKGDLHSVKLVFVPAHKLLKRL